MKYDFILKNGTLVNTYGSVKSDIAIKDDKIVAVGKDLLATEAKKVFDVAGQYVLPGLIDPHVHFGTGDINGYDTMVEDFKVNSKDAILGGVTSLVTTAMPGSAPLADLFKKSLTAADKHSYVNYKFTPIVGTPDHVKEIAQVADMGGVSFKFFTGYKGEQAEGLGMLPEGVDPDMFFLATEQLAKYGKGRFPAIHAEDPFVRGILVDRLYKEFPDAGNLVRFAESSPRWAEAVQIITYGFVAKTNGVPIYPVHLSTSDTMDALDWLRTQGVHVIGETLALFLSTTAEEMDAKGASTRAKIQPPIRSEGDRQGLWGGIQNGNISIVGTDSLTYSSKYKDNVNFWDCRVGVNLQVADTLSLMHDEGVNKGRITIEQLVAITSTNTARQFGFYPKKGTLNPGADADIVVFDPNKEMVLGADRLLGHSDYSLWEGRKVKGAPTMTFLAGNLVVENGELTDETPHGEYVSSGAI